MHLETNSASLVAAARHVGHRLAFPVADLDEAESRTEGRAVVVDHALLTAVDLLVAPRFTVYAVTADAAGAVTTRVAAVESRSGEHLAVVVVGSGATVRTVGQQDLVRSVVDAVGIAGTFSAGSLFGRDLTVPLRIVEADDRSVVADGMRGQRVPRDEIDAWLSAGRSLGSGLLGAIATDAFGMAQHVTRSISWHRYASGSVLVVEQPRRARREPEVLLQALSARTLTRAALDLLTSLNSQSGREPTSLARTS